MIIRSLRGDMVRRQYTKRHGALRSELRMDESNDDATEEARRLAFWGPSPFERATKRTREREASARVIQQIRDELQGDDDCQLVAIAWEDDPENVQRADGIAATGLAPADYDAAVKRIRYMLSNLPGERLDGVADAMEESHG